MPKVMLTKYAFTEDGFMQFMRDVDDIINKIDGDNFIPSTNVLSAAVSTAVTSSTATANARSTDISKVLGLVNEIRSVLISHKLCT